MTAKDLTPYYLLLNTLLKYETDEQAVNQLMQDSILVDDILLNTIATRNFPTEFTEHDLQRIHKIISNGLINKRLIEYLKVSLLEAFAFVLEHPELLMSHSTYSTVAHLLNKYSQNSNTYNDLLERQAILAKAAAELVTFQRDWGKARAIFLQGIFWLSHPSAQAHFKRLAIEHPEHIDFLSYLTESIKRCVSEGPGKFVNETDFSVFLAEVAQAQGSDRISLLQEALSSTQFSDTHQRAELQLKLGNTLCNYTSDEIFQNQENIIQAYEPALKVFTLKDHPEQWAQIHNNLSNIYLKRVNGDRTQNLKYAIQASQNAMEVYSREEDAKSWAAAQFNIGLAYRNLQHEDRAQNLEDAIQAFLYALGVYTQEQHPSEWAVIQFNLATIYQDRVRGDQAHNLESAIQAFQHALEVFTRDEYAVDWAMIQYSLGLLYCDRPRGDRAQNIEDAIQAFEQALKVNTRNEYAEQWAHIQTNLGVAYRDRLRGDRTQNLEDAIQAFRHALEVYTQEQHAKSWAHTQNSLAGVYRDRLRGDRAQNIEDSIQTYEQALKVNTRVLFPKQWAEIQISLGAVYQDRLHGDRAQNIDDAIQALQQSLKICTREEYLKLWAIAQNNLGNAYYSSLRGSRTQNLEDAIQAFRHALEVYTRNEYAIRWAGIQNSLGLAYRDRLRGNRTQNLEDAIQAFRQALEVYTRNEYAEQWAGIQTNLGITYRDRLRGDRAQNLEDAIQAFRHALEVHTQDEYAVDWASIQNSLGLAYRDRLRGERAQNLEDGICSLRNALQVRKREHYASDWAMTQNNLGLLYWDRLRGDRAQNIEDAIQAFEQALEVHTRDEYTNQWVLIQTNLGGVYRDRLRGDRAQNIEDAIAIILHTLEVSKREDHPELWAIMQNNLGGAYHDRLRGDRAQNLEDAISALQQALEVYTQEEYAERWATTQTNLGVIYRDRLRGERTENIEKAVALFQQALQILTSEQFSRAHRDTAYYLGIVLYEEQRWAEARAAHESAHEALTLLRGETLREESRRQLAKENDLLYATLIHCCLQMNDTHAAATYALSGKSRSLTEVLAGDSQSLDEVLSQDIKLAKEWEPVQDLKFELNTLLASKNLIKHSSRIAELRQEINYHIDTLLFRFPALVAVQPLPSLSIEQTQTLSQLLGNTPLIEYIRHKGGWGAFIITPDNVVYVPLAENLDELLEADMTSILNDSFWIQNKKLLDRSKELAQMYTLVIEPLQPYISATGSLVLAPTQLLHLIPFQALLSPKGLYLSENYSLGFVPSLTTLHVLYEQRQQHKLSEKIVQTEQLLSVAYSGEGRNYLPSVREEAEAVSSYFTKPVQLLEDEALPENLFNAVASHAFEVIHVGCHGKFNIKNPLDSALELAQGQLLTVNDIRIRLRLRGYPLVVLSACQTGQTRPEQGDETNGLSWAFLAAGASAVVSSQWSVPDQATHELFKVFYLVRQQTHIGDVEALQQAINQLQKDEKYYRKPFYWGAFQIMGLPFTL